MTRALPVDPLKVSDYRRGIENRLAAFETTHFQPPVPGFLLPTDAISGFVASNFSVMTDSPNYVAMYQGRIEQMVRPAIIVGFPFAPSGSYATGSYAAPAGATGEFRLRIQNSVGADVVTPSTSQPLGYYLGEYLFYWQHGVKLWTNEIYTLSVEARRTSPTATDQVIIIQPIAGFEQTGLTLAGRTPQEKQLTYERFGRVVSPFFTPRATTNGLGTF
jgi:hypothetical protein